MGRLSVFNRKIALAPDDVYIPAFYGLILHGVWLASTWVVYSVVAADCNVNPIVNRFLLVLLSTLCLQVPVDATMIALSMSGTVAREGLRRFVGPAVQFSFCILMFELAVECFGIFVTFGPGRYLDTYQDPLCTNPVDDTTAALIHMVVIWSFLAIVFYFIGLAIFLLAGDSKSGRKIDNYMRIWQQRLNYVVGTGGLVDSDVLRDVAGELANYFKDFDWAASDVAIGLILLKREQKRITEVRQARRLLIEQPDGFLIPTLESQKLREELAAVHGEDESSSRRMAWINGGKLGGSGASGSRSKLFKAMARGLSIGVPSKENLKSGPPSANSPSSPGRDRKPDNKTLLFFGRSRENLQSSPATAKGGMMSSPITENSRLVEPKLVDSPLSPMLFGKAGSSPLVPDVTSPLFADSEKLNFRSNTEPNLTSVARVQSLLPVERIFSEPEGNDFVIAVEDDVHDIKKKNGDSSTKPVGLGVSFADEVKNDGGGRKTIPLKDFDHAIPIKDGSSTDDEGGITDDGGPSTGRKNIPKKKKFSMKSPSMGGFKGVSMQRSMSLQKGLRQSNSKIMVQSQPFMFGKKKAMGSHRSNSTRIRQHGSLLREEIDDILHFARFAEVVYTPQEIDTIYSDRLHFHSNDNGIFRSPFLIVHDLETDSIVIAIRGTYSASDVLVDLKFDVLPFDVPGLEVTEGSEVHLAHSGFLNTAKNIVGDIRRLNVLGPLLNDPSSDFYGSSLVVTGHSLGAGVAALVANMLRQDFPSTCCYAYEPPGCVVSAQAAEFFESFCTSVVMGDDVVTRLSRNTLEMLKLDIDRHLKNCNDPKWRVVGGALGNRLCCSGSNSSSGKGKVDRPGLLHRRTPSGHLIPADYETLKRRTNSLRVGKDNPFYDIQLPQVPMYIPGKILHIEKLRRPPLKLNQMIGRQIAKVTDVTKAVGKNIKLGAEGIKDIVVDNVVEIVKDGVEFAEDVKDIILDGADIVKEKIMDGGKRAGGPSGNSDLPVTITDQNLGFVGLVPLNDNEAASGGVRKRSSFGDVFMSRTKSSGDTRLKQKDAEKIELSGDAVQELTSPERKVVFSEAGPSSTDGNGFNLSADDLNAQSRKGRTSRRTERKLKRARSSGNVPMARSRSIGRDGYDTNIEQSDDEENGNAGIARRRSSKKQLRNEGALTDTEVFSDSELEGGGRFGMKVSDRKGAVGSVLNDSEGQFKFPRIITSLGNNRNMAPRSAESPDSPVRASRLNPELISASIKPRAHKEAVPSESITGRVVPVGSAQLKEGGKMGLGQSGEFISPSKDQATPSQVIPTPQSQSVPPSPESETLVKNVVHGSGQSVLPAVSEEPEDEISIPKRNPTISIAANEELVLSKPQYPPNSKPGDIQVVKGPKTRGKYHYVPRWARKEEFQEIIVSRSMIADHSPFELLREFQVAPPGSVLGVVTRD